MCYPKSDEVKRAVNEALRRFYLNDRYLIDHNVNERSLTFRLGFYLQQIFSGWDVDCEYNRNVAAGNGRKQLPDPDLPGHALKDIYPDIIIHKRGMKRNLLLIEAKKMNVTDDDRNADMARTKKSCSYKALGYRYGLFLEFKSSLKKTLDAAVFINKNGENSLRIKSRATNDNEVK